MSFGAPSSYCKASVLLAWAHSFRALSLPAICVLSSSLVSSCLTPNIDYDAPIDGAESDGGRVNNEGSEPTSGDEYSGSGGRGTSTQGEGDVDDDVPDRCENRVLDGDETDIDCGGLDCSKCSTGRRCEGPVDCAIDACTGGRCQLPSCTDEFLTMGETDRDCGGDECPACGAGLKCKADEDCESSVCNDGRCATASCNDRTKNQGELDIDCGDPCGLCEVGQSCVFSRDCLQPEEAESEARCEANLCILDCNLATGDCNEKAVDGCESNLNTDLNNCGVCGQSCNLPNTLTTICAGGKCEIDFGMGEADRGCAPGYADCNSDPSDGCEVDLQADPSNCGECKAVCSDNHNTPSCESGECVVDCEEDFADCDEEPKTNGCEVNLLSNPSHCGGCGETFACDEGSTGQSPNCNQGQCEYIACPEGTGACDGDGACNDALTTTYNCGTCGESCEAANGVAACVNSAPSSCSITSCGEGFGNCDNNYGTGCETNTSTSKDHCGACNRSGVKNCNYLETTASLRVAQASCSDGGCLITSCDMGYADCDLNPDNGCEMSLANNKTRCGGCLPSDARSQNGVDCSSAWNHADGSCNNAGICVFDSCDTNFSNCNSSLTDGCEVDVRNNPLHCGACNSTCQTNSTTSSNLCSNSVCGPVCVSGGQDCDANPKNGCENITSDENHCGGCGNTCDVLAGTSSNTCTASQCVPVCSSPSSQWQECLDPTNGCEDKSADEAHCGACGVECSRSPDAHVSSNSCTAGQCQPQCAFSYYKDCNSDRPDGCETDTRSSATNCNGCGIVCGGSSKTNVSGTPSCSTSTCSVSCNPGYCNDTSDPERKCSVTTGTSANCLSCGNVCSGTNPFCDGSNGCKQRFPVGLVNSWPGQATSSNTATINFSLTNGPGSNRALVVAVAYGQPTAEIKYGTSDMLLAGSQKAGGQPGYAAVYYLLDAALGSAGSKTITLKAGWGGTVARAYELVNVAQTAPSHSGMNQTTANCPVNNTLSAKVVQPGSFVVGTLLASGASTTGTHIGFGTEVTELYQGETTTGMVGHLLNASANTTVGWNTIGACWSTALVTATFDPLITGP